MKRHKAMNPKTKAIGITLLEEDAESLKSLAYWAGIHSATFCGVNGFGKYGVATLATKIITDYIKRHKKDIEAYNEWRKKKMEEYCHD